MGCPGGPKQAGVACAEESKFTSDQSRTRVRLVRSVRKCSSSPVYISPAAASREACNGSSPRAHAALITITVRPASRLRLTLKENHLPHSLLIARSQ